MKRLILSLATLFLLSPLAMAKTYVVDVPHTQVSFSAQHMAFFTVRGTFTDFSGEVDADPATQMVKSVSAMIKVASIDTRNQKRDDHLKSADFFDVAKYPEIKFVSTSITGKGANVTVKGDLTIHGVTKPVTLTGSFNGTIKDPWGKERAGFVAAGKVDRKDFGMTWNKMLETGGLLVGDNIDITIEVEAVEK